MVARLGKKSGGRWAVLGQGPLDRECGLMVAPLRPPRSLSLLLALSLFTPSGLPCPPSVLSERPLPLTDLCTHTPRSALLLRYPGRLPAGGASAFSPCSIKSAPTVFFLSVRQTARAHPLPPAPFERPVPLNAGLHDRPPRGGRCGPDCCGPPRPPRMRPHAGPGTVACAAAPSDPGAARPPGKCRYPGGRGGRR